MDDKKVLLDNIDRIHTTEMGVDRIKRNLKLNIADVVEYSKDKILQRDCNIYKQGKTFCTATRLLLKCLSCSCRCMLKVSGVF